MSLGSRIKERREELQLSRNALAMKIGVTPSAIANYENGISSPKIELMYKLFDALDCDANYLHQDDMKSRNHYKSMATPEEFENIIKKYRDLDDFGRETVDLVLARELTRTKSLTQKDDLIQQLRNVSVPAAVRYIHYYQRLASAGTGQLVFDNLPVDLLEIPDIPEYRKAKYAIGVNGRSMEPEYKDGDIVLVAPDIEVSVGDIGIFIDRSDAYIKKLGKDELISLNPECRNVPLTQDTRCLGYVVDKYTPGLKPEDEEALRSAHDILSGKDIFNKRLG